jgi:hypothetical protein
MVTLEFLRSGPPHNQLLSPLTPYLAVCGDAGATVMNVPWEHAPFERDLEDLRYEGEAGEDPSRRLALLEKMGRHIAQLLGAIPALSGVMAVDSSQGTPDVTHLRIVLSASELSLIPYELSKTPAGLEMPAENWLLLQVHVPICMTRHIRSVPCDGTRWPDRARMLFVASDPAELPFEQHKDVLLRAVRPWLKPGDAKPEHSIEGISCQGELEVYGDVLTIITDARLDDVKTLCRVRDYSHVHVLAHGGEDETANYRSFGIGLGGEIVTGTRFASALTTTSNRDTRQPTIVTLASCDSANVGSVVRAGASFAHSLHQAGIPLVIASQFPLSFDGSVTALRRMFVPLDGLLWGACHPIGMLHDIRRELLVENETHSHDWASLVVYEAFPENLEQQLEDFHYRQAKAALKASEDQLEDIVDKAWDDENDQWIEEEAFQTRLYAARECGERARATLPTRGPYAMESLGLQASNAKTNAEASFKIAMMYSANHEQYEQNLKECYQGLEKAFDDYDRAIKGFLHPGDEVLQREAQLHWVVVQMLTMGTVLGRELEANFWWLGEKSAQADILLPAIDQRAWAYGSLAELALLRLANEQLPKAEQDRNTERAIQAIRQLVGLYPKRGAWQIESTHRQFRRYLDWWGDENFVGYLKGQGVERRRDWNRSGVMDAAREITAILIQRLWEEE